MEGPKAPSEARIKARSAEGVGSGEGRRSPSPVWGSVGYAPRKIFKKINVDIAYFSAFLQAEMHRRRNDFKSGGALSPVKKKIYSAPPLLP